MPSFIKTGIAIADVRLLGLPQWRRIAEKPENRCLIPLTEFCEWSRDKDPEHGIGAKYGSA